MSTNKYQDEFDQLLSEEANKGKMYASDQVWRNIHKELHGHKKWPALTIVAVLMIAALTLSTVFVHKPSQTTLLTEKEPLTPTTVGGRIVAKEDIELFKEHISPNTITQKTLNNIAKAKRTKDSLEEALATVMIEENKTTAQPLATDKNTNNSTNTLNTIDANTFVKQQATAKMLALQAEIDKNSQALAKANTAKASDKKINYNKLVATNHAFDEDAVNKADAFNSDMAHTPIKVPVKKKASKLSWQVHVTPSASFRKLSDDKARNAYFRQQEGPFNLSYSAGINEVVRHKPALGIEVGGAMMYSITNRTRVKVGLQFNSRQYYIDAYQSLLNVAGITIVGNGGLDTLTSLTDLSNTNGYGKTKLDNKLYQISMPVGLEVDVLKYKKWALTASASFQPTYTFNKDLYIISTDYKYYTKGDNFIRKWNINSSVELNVSYKIGDYKLFVGPQMRYQHLPTYSNLYPIKEHRVDYGIKLGFTKTIF